EVTPLVVVVGTAKDAHQRVFALATANAGNDGTVVVSTHQVQVVDIPHDQVLTECPDVLGVPGFVIESAHGRDMVVSAEGIVVVGKRVERFVFAGAYVFRQPVNPRSSGIRLHRAIRKHTVIQAVA